MNQEPKEIRTFQIGINKIGDLNWKHDEGIVRRICESIGAELIQYSEEDAWIAVISQEMYNELESQENPIETGLSQIIEFEGEEYEFEIPGI